MNERVHRYLDGEIPQRDLSPDEVREATACEAIAREAGDLQRAIDVPDLTARVMAALPVERHERSPATDVPAPAAGPAPRAGGDVLTGALQWLWTPRPVRLRPAYAMLGAAALLFIITTAGTGLLMPGPTQNATVGPGAGESRPSTVFVQFRLDAPDASVVRLAGSFTSWEPAYTLHQTAPGVWSILIPLQPGVHDYAFVLNGERWVADPAAPAVDDGFGGVNSRLSVLLPDPVGEPRS